MRRTLSVTLGACLLLSISLAPPAAAELCSVDHVPAATLLLPYFEVSLRKKRTSTVFSLANSMAAPTVAHVTLWTDWAVPTFTFDVFLTGFDVQTFDLRELFDEGLLPQTAHAQNDPSDTISPHSGDFSDNRNWDSDVDPAVSPIRFPGCDGLLPPAPLDEAALDRLRNSHTGREMGTGCVAFDHGDDTARGYLTIDNVVDCNLLFPGEPDYFDGATFASNENQLWGEWWIAEKGKGLAAAPLVAVEAQAGAFGPGDYTFYGRYSNGQATDAREPLGTSWGTRTTNSKIRFGKPSKPLTNELVIWRDPTENLLATSYACGSAVPAWFPLNETQVVAFDEQEQALQLCGIVAPADDPTCAPLATQRIASNDGDLASPFTAGWVFLNLNQSFVGSPFGSLAQSHVATLSSVKKLRGNLPAVQFTSACP